MAGDRNADMMPYGSDTWNQGNSLSDPAGRLSRRAEIGQSQANSHPASFIVNFVTITLDCKFDLSNRAMRVPTSVHENVLRPACVDCRQSR